MLVNIVPLGLLFYETSRAFRNIHGTLVLTLLKNHDQIIQALEGRIVQKQRWVSPCADVP